MNIEELEKLKIQLLQNKIDPFKIGSMLFENESKAWNTEEWRNIREEKLQNKCSQCGSIEGLRLQHTWTPKSYSQVKDEIFTKYRELIRIEYPIDDIVKDNEVQTYFEEEYKQKNKNICPKCESINLRIRKTMQQVYKCQRCEYEFDKPELKLVPTLIDDRKENIELSPSDKSFKSIQNKIAKERYYKLIQEKYGYKLEKEVLTIIIDEYLSYFRGEGTVTLCKRCGFALKEGKNLCPKCKSKYKSIYLDTCKECK